MNKRFKAAAANIALTFGLLTATQAVAAPFLVIGLDNKLHWDAKGQRQLTAPGRDAVVVVDLAKPEQPRIVATLPLENSVSGPPVNLAVSPDNRVAIVANSVTNVPKADGGFDMVSADELFVIDLKAPRPRLAQTLKVGKRPSGLSINPAGTLALVSYREDSAIGVFRIERGRLREVGRVDVKESPSHVAFTPDGRRALAVKQEVNKVALLDVVGDRLTYAGVDLPTSKGPYNVEVTPNGRLGITSDSGKLTVVDLAAVPPRVIDTVAVEPGSEGLAISPRGDIAISVALLGSNGDQSSPKYHEKGAIVVLRIDGAKLTPIRTIEVGRVPEGVGFSPDGRHLYVANFYDDDVWIFRVDGTGVTDTGKRLKLPGRPASARTTPAPLGKRTK